VRNLPHQLVEAFTSTLETVAEADLLVHVVDASAADPEGQMLAVRTVLDDIEANRVPELLVFNKADLTTEAKRLVEQHPASVSISALTGEGIEEFLQTVGDRLRALTTVTELFIPYERGDMAAAAHREGEVVSESHEDAGVRLRVRLDAGASGKLAPWVVA
jgi:GTP-binding protein HflX